MTDGNYIIIRSVFGKVGQKYFLNPAKDPETNRFPDCVKHVDSKGDMILTEAERNSGEYFIPEDALIIIEDGKSFNLDDPYEAAQWHAIQHSRIIAMSRDARDKRGNLIIDGDAKRYGSAELYIERPGYEIKKKNSKKKLINVAESLIFNSSLEDQVKLARLLGKNMKNAPAADVEDWLLQKAAKDPQLVIDMKQGDDSIYRILFYDATDKFIITTKNKLYVYGDEGIVLGATDEAAIAWLKDPNHKKILEMIKKETYPHLYPTDDKQASKTDDNTVDSKDKQKK
jgi:hypothetical protein